MRAKRMISRCLIGPTEVAFVSLILEGGLATSLAAPGTWTRKADMPTARYDSSASAVDGKIYVIGGATPRSGSLAAVERYDPATDTWTRMASMPTRRNGLSTCALNGKIYAIGGFYQGSRLTPLATVEEYDPTTDQWTTKAPMPTARGSLSVSTVNGKIYAAGGWPGGSLLGLSTVEQYDPIADTWTKRANLPTPRLGLSSSVAGGKVYAIGGLADSRTRLNPVSTVEEYDPETDTWTTKAEMPTPREAMSTSVANGRIYAAGGTQDESAGLSTIEVYDPTLDRWSRVDDMPTARYYFSTSVVNGKIYVLGGLSRFPNLITAVEEYDPALSGGGANPKLQPVLGGKSRGQDGFELTFTGEVGRSYRLQASANLASDNWIDLATLTSTQTTTTFLDSAAANFPQRFYRVVSP